MKCEFQKPIVEILTFIEYICDFCPKKIEVGKRNNRYWNDEIKECYLCSKDTCKKCRKEWHKGFDDPDSDQYYSHSFYICLKCCPFFEQMVEDLEWCFIGDNDIYDFESAVKRNYKRYRTLENYLNFEPYES